MLTPMVTNSTSICRSFQQQVSAAPLAVYRIGFGSMMLISILRFAWNGWINKLYIQPTFFFSFSGFEWVKPLGEWTYLLFFIAGVSATCIALGYRYRLAAITFFLSFTYIELIDKTTYLNHYYFISIVAFTLIWLPAADHFSLDARRKGDKSTVPAWTIWSLKALIAVVYFYAGLAKLNSDWLIHAQPLATWLPAKYDIPLLGDWLQLRWVHYAFAWAGALFDLFIPWLLMIRRTRVIAFVGVVVFHVLTRILFPIGMFPFIMIVGALIFLDPKIHQRIIEFLRSRMSSFFGGTQVQSASDTTRQARKPWYGVLSPYIVTLVVLLHILLPWRYLLSPGELFWTESGFRFSWRVMLIEKAGYAEFRVVDKQNQQQVRVDNRQFLTAFQEKQMSTQLDFIVEYAQFLADYYQKKGMNSPAVYVDSYVALNGRQSQQYVRPDIDLTKVDPGQNRTLWLAPFDDIIYGL